MPIFWKFKSFLKWYRSGITIYDIHSPSVYSLVESVEKGSIRDEDGREILEFRQMLRKDRKMFKKMGAGPKDGMSSSMKETVGNFARKSQAPLYNYRRLYRLAEFLSAENILELGTGSGLGHYILRKARPEAMITSVDADPFLTEMARANIGRNYHKSSFICEHFSSFLEDESVRQTAWDLIVLDGDHRGVALLNNYHLINNFSQKNGKLPVFFIDDIRWSEAMLAAWSELYLMHEGIALDYFLFGILAPHQQEDFLFRAGILPYKGKPWRAGFFGK
ncbi:MAG: hypothetical protein EA409_10340 [Saprospirales bacterium]|nr:MAG: hypothetical protein EA409_10340 [Saprospirales bacterium]